MKFWLLATLIVIGVIAALIGGIVGLLMAPHWIGVSFFGTIVVAGVCFLLYMMTTAMHDALQSKVPSNGLRWLFSVLITLGGLAAVVGFITISTAFWWIMPSFFGAFVLVMLVAMVRAQLVERSPG